MEEAERRLRIVRLIVRSGLGTADLAQHDRHVVAWRASKVDGVLWARLSNELKQLMDADPDCANAHVADFWAEIRRRNAGFIAGVPPLKLSEEVLLPEPPVYQIRKVPNPDLEAELDAAGDDRAARGKVQRVVGRATDLTSLCGGLARLEERTTAQTLAAIELRRLFEDAMIGGSKAIDYGVVRVDTSLMSVATILNVGEDARTAYNNAIIALGDAAQLVQLVVCHGCSLREAARTLGTGDGYRKRLVLQVRLLSALNVLATHFGIVGGRRRLRSEGERPTDTSKDVTIHRKACLAA